MSRNAEWAIGEASLFFEGKGAVQESLGKITAKLNELKIPYVVVGGMALFNHGFRRYTDYVDILVTRDGLKDITTLSTASAIFGRSLRVRIFATWKRK